MYWSFTTLEVNTNVKLVQKNIIIIINYNNKFS